MIPSRLSDQLVLVARARVGDKSVRNEANLRRATSDLYYAMFHAICEALVEPLGGSPDNGAFVETFTKIYRQTHHAHAEKRCRAVAKDSSFPPAISRFAKLFVTLKNKRELADYHPLEKFRISVVRNDCDTAEARLADFWSTDSKERATFACFVGLRLSKENQDAT